MAEKPEQGNKTLKTLTDDDIVAETPVDRRSALRVLGTAVIGSAVATVMLRPGEARAQTGITDSDSGANADGAGNGRGRPRPAARRRTGFTDRDSGPGADGAGYGVCPSRGHTDSDSGGGSDGAGRGRGPCH
jgi:hypothetical protein